MTEPEITVNKLSYHIPVQILGLDEQGRQLYRCPSAGCGDTAYFDEDGRGHCPTDEAMLALIRDAYERLTSQTPECNHATCLELSVPGQSHRTWQCTTCGAQVELPGPVDLDVMRGSERQSARDLRSVEAKPQVSTLRLHHKSNYGVAANRDKQPHLGPWGVAHRGVPWGA